MVAANERDQTRPPDFEPRSPEEKINNKSIHFRLTNIVKVPPGYIARTQSFIKTDDPISLLVRNVHYINTYPSTYPSHNWFSSPSSFLRIINWEDESSNVVTYFFNNKGHSIKKVADNKQEIGNGLVIGSGTWSRMNPEDYDNAHQALVKIESGEFSTSNPRRSPLF